MYFNELRQPPGRSHQDTILLFEWTFVRLCSIHVLAKLYNQVRILLRFAKLHTKDGIANGIYHSLGLKT